MKPELSIIIVSYNTKQITRNCVESIYDSTAPCEIVVIDNLSTDGSQEMLQEYQKKHNNFHLIQNAQNVGFAKANNQGVKIAKGEYILFLNSDIVVLEDAIQKLFTYYKENENRIHFLGGKLLNADKTPQTSCGPSYSLAVVFAALFLRGDYWGLTRYSPTKVQEVDWVSGACILTKKECFDAVGGFDENIFMYMDEIDLLYRAKQKGHRVFFYSNAQFIHLGSASSNNRTYPIQQVFKGLLYFYKKHHNGLSLLFLKIMLQLKSLIAISIGKATHNHYLISTYEEALKLARMD
ncbi:glycosyltransferase family 2 protein [Candidatus Roizmanbacteria bacterium]|nr:glycosyltransferase family 2 protein [Candidatus Roizmanbacteria bacterium]